MTLATHLKPQKSPTYQVLDAIRAITSHQENASTGLKANMAYIVATTGLSGRTVNALVYALEKQHRVVAHSYDVARRHQIFTILRYEPNEPQALTERRTSRCHPAKSAKAIAQTPDPSLISSFPKLDASLADTKLELKSQNQSTQRRAEICSSTVHQRSRFHHAHPANRAAHRELQAVEDFELLFTSFFTASPVLTDTDELDQIDVANEHDNAFVQGEHVAPAVCEAAVGQNGGFFRPPHWNAGPGAGSAAPRRTTSRRFFGAPRGSRRISPPPRASQSSLQQVHRPWPPHHGGYWLIAGPPKEKPPLPLTKREWGLGTQGKRATEESEETLLRNRSMINALARNSGFLSRTMPITRRSVPNISSSG